MADIPDDAASVATVEIVTPTRSEKILNSMRRLSGSLTGSDMKRQLAEEYVVKSPGDKRKSLGTLSTEEKVLTALLVELRQEHLFQKWDPKGENDERKREFFRQVQLLNSSYPGGLKAYIERARALLEASKNGENPLNGWLPSVPSGVTLEPFTPKYDELETLGKTALGSVGFVLVAGGLGERLGYNGIKVELPSETTTSICYLQLYCQQILAFQRRYAPADRLLPLAIMVSDDTKTKTIDLLKRNAYFGLSESQVSILKQEKVAALVSADGKISQISPYVIDSKPHGHGDVHSLMYASGVAAEWLSKGISHVAFFQDTNGLCFFTLAAMLGVSLSLGLEVNSLTVPRKAKQAVGAITRLVKKDDPEGTEMTVNVEYNQLDPLLRATGYPEGDVNDPDTGLSPYPGNINQLVFKLAPYLANLERTKGLMGEFVNPKYADSSKTVFKKPTRLECMMQDYPKALSKDAKVGFTLAPAWICYSPCKNNSIDAAASIKSGVPAGSAFTAEADQYFAAAEILRQIGANVEKSPEVSFLDIAAMPGPRIVFHPSFGVLPGDIQARFPTPDQVSISARSTLVVDGDVVIHSLKLDGYLRLVAVPGTRLTVRAENFPIANKGSELVAVQGDGLSEVDRMRGYRIIVIQEEYITTASLLSRVTDAARSVLSPLSASAHALADSAVTSIVNETKEVTEYSSRVKSTPTEGLTSETEAETKEDPASPLHTREGFDFESATTPRSGSIAPPLITSPNILTSDLTTASTTLTTVSTEFHEFVYTGATVMPLSAYEGDVNSPADAIAVINEQACECFAWVKNLKLF